MFKEELLVEAIESGPEIMTYMLIDNIGAFTWRMNHDMADGRIPKKDHAAIDEDIKQAVKEQQRLVRSLTRFGVKTPLDENDRPTEEYWKWYRWWSEWHKSTLTNEQWDELNAVLGMEMTEEQIQKYRPEGDWRTT